jgi:prephenate dehydrogenase
MARVNLTIIGLQRLGASFGLALKRQMKAPDAQHEFVITGSDEDQAAMDEALKLGAIDKKVRDLASAVEQADLVILASRHGLTEDIFRAIGPSLKPGAVVMDTSPLKLAAIGWAKKHFRRGSSGEYEAYLVGVTPIVNPDYLADPRGETDAAQADLFDKGQLVISPAADCPQEAVQLVADLASLLDLKVHFTDPAEHDGLVAAMENLPALIQLGLFRSLSTSSAWGDLQRLSNPRFALATYLLEQGSPEDFALPIHENRENTIRALETLIGTLDEVRDVLLTGDDLMLQQAFSDAMQRYERWQVARRRNDWGDQPEAPQLPSGNLLGGLLGPFGRKKPKDDDQKQR